MEYVGLASSIICFIEVGCKVAKCYSDIRSSASGATETNDHVMTMTHDLEDATRSIKAFDSTRIDEELHDLAEKCEKLSTQLISILHGLQPSRPGKLRALLKSIEIYRREEEIRRMEGLLVGYRQQLMLRLQLLMLCVNLIVGLRQHNCGLSNSSRL